MSRLKLIGIILAGLLLTPVLAVALAFSAGAVHVRVEEHKPGGERLNLYLPAAALPLGLKLVPNEQRWEMAAQLRPWLPALEIAGRELARASDAVLVEIKSPGEWVRVAKEGRSLVVDVDSKEETVHVSFPLKTLAGVAAELAATAPAGQPIS